MEAPRVDGLLELSRRYALCRQQLRNLPLQQRLALDAERLLHEKRIIEGVVGERSARHFRTVDYLVAPPFHT